MILIITAIVLRLAYSQFIAYDGIYSKALDSWQRGFPLEAARGKIYDSQNKVLVDNLTTSSLIVVPSLIQDADYMAKQLAAILECDETKLLKKIQKKVSVERIQPEGRQLAEEKAYSIDRLKLPGVYLVQDTLRY